MTERERLVETMAKALNDKHGPETMDEVDWEDADEVFKEQYRDDMRFVVAALEADGYAVYRLVDDPPWVPEDDGAMGPAPDPNIKHHPRCCYSRGCHNICSHSCGTDHAIDPDWESDGGEQ